MGWWRTCQSSSALAEEGLAPFRILPSAVDHGIRYSSFLACLTVGRIPPLAFGLGASRLGRAKETSMFLARRIGWAGIAVVLLTAAIVLRFPRSAAASDFDKEVASTHLSEIKKMQEALRDAGHYRGKVDGVLGLRTRASIRAYQKAENLPVTGELDARTAGKLGLKPEEHDDVQTTQGKPSAGIKWRKGLKATGRTAQSSQAGRPL